MRPATLISIVALFFSLSAGSAGFAAGRLIGSADIQDHSIQLRDISPAAIKALRGQHGPQGPPGPAGAPGTFSTADVTRATGATVEVAPGQVQTASVDCPQGQVAIGGGGAGGIAGLAASVPLTATGSTTPLGWAVIVVNQTQVTVTESAFVVCAASG